MLKRHMIGLGFGALTVVLSCSLALAGGGGVGTEPRAAPELPAPKEAIQALPGVPIVVPRDPPVTRARLEANFKEIVKVLDDAGQPISEADRAAFAATSALSDHEAVGKLQQLLDPYVLLTIDIDGEAWFRVVPASASPKSRELVKGRWKTFLAKIHNDARVGGPMKVRSPQALDVPADFKYDQKAGCNQDHDWAHWFVLSEVGGPLMPEAMSGKEIEYIPVRICSLDAGMRAAELVFFLGGGQVSQGHYGGSTLLFNVVAN